LLILICSKVQEDHQLLEIRISKCSLL
jgi:hypothetical protein